jgi:hypothetical protein
MKANELMIGDWVEVINSDHIKHAQVNGILANSIYTKEAEYESEEIAIDNIEPIPLTPEILEKNGFEHIKQKVIIPSKSQEEVEVEYMYCKGLPCSFDIIHGYLMFNSNIDLCSIRMLVNYVHELQHLLKLCGIDKEIVV